MSRAKVLVVKCMDSRVQTAVREFLGSEGFPEGTWVPQSPPGASLNIDTVLLWIDMAIMELGTDSIFIFDHEDCMAYKKAFNVDHACDHLKYLWEAQQLLKAKYPNVKIRTFLMVFQNGEGWDIQETEG